MSNLPAMEADFKSEERYARLKLIFKASNNEEKMIEERIKEITNKYSLTPICCCIEGKEGSFQYNIEYHDDYDKEAGDIFEDIMRQLNITSCS